MVPGTVLSFDRFLICKASGEECRDEKKVDSEEEQYWW